MGRSQALGYVDAACTASDSLFPAGTTYRGHEFHYTKLNVAGDVRYALELRRGNGIGDGRDGIHLNNVLAGDMHAYFTHGQASGLMETIRRISRA